MGREHAIGASRVDPLSVFLSYDRDDTQAAQSFVKALEAQGFSIWWDGLISGGHAFADRIQQALADSDVIVVLWSESSSKSHWVRDEAGFGRDHSRLACGVSGSGAQVRKIPHDANSWAAWRTAATMCG